MLERFLRLFPQRSIKNIWLSYVLTIFNSCWFITGNWLFFWLRFMTYGQLGWVDASCFLFGLSMEVPSGAISDLLGKRKTVIASQICATIGLFGMAFSTSLWHLWGSFLIVQLGWALYSGAAEALTYDTLVSHKKEDSFDEVMGMISTLRSITAVIAALVGGWLFTVHVRLPHIAWAAANTVGLVASWWLLEPKVDTEKFSWHAYWTHLVEGTKHLFVPHLRPYLLSMFALLGFDYLFQYGLIKPAVFIHFGYLADAQAVWLAVIGIVMGLVANYIPYLRQRISDKLGLALLVVIMSAGYFLAALPLGYWGIITIFMIFFAGTLAFPWASIVVNKEISAKYRATTLSTLALITKIPYVLLAVVAGGLVEKNQLSIFMIGTGTVLLTALGWNAVSKK